MDQKPTMPVAISLSEILAQRSRRAETPELEIAESGQNRPAQMPPKQIEAPQSAAPTGRKSQPRPRTIDPSLTDFWKSKTVQVAKGKSSIHLRVDSDVLEWFKAQGKGHLTRMNAVLRAYMEAKRG